MKFTNNFHQTTVTAYPRDGLLNRRQVRRIRAALCPPDCTCADNALGTRGPQHVRMTFCDHGWGYVLVEKLEGEER